MKIRPESMETFRNPTPLISSGYAPDTCMYTHYVHTLLCVMHVSDKEWASLGCMLSPEASIWLKTGDCGSGLENWESRVLKVQEARSTEWRESSPEFLFNIPNTS